MYINLCRPLACSKQVVVTYFHYHKQAASRHLPCLRHLFHPLGLEQLTFSFLTVFSLQRLVLESQEGLPYNQFIRNIKLTTVLHVYSYTVQLSVSTPSRPLFHKLIRLYIG